MKEDDEKKKEVKIWKVYLALEDEVGPTYFQEKEDAVDYIMVKIKKAMMRDDEYYYDNDGGLIKSRVGFDLQSYSLN